ncbi:MAG: L-threonylcarbamoyladenylate synthase [Bacteroidota bacterium]
MGVIGKDLEKAIEALTTSELVGIPTETVYGLAANAMNPNAVTRIFTAKDRPTFHPLIVHIHSLAQAQNWVEAIPPKILKLTDTLWPGPLTILLKRKAGGIPDIVTGGSPWVGLRVPQHPVTLELLNRLPFPLAAPSANRFGYVSPTTPQHVADQLEEEVAYILDGGPSLIGVESTIVQVDEEDTCRVLRPGGVSIELIQTLVGPVSLAKPDTSIRTSGTLKSHYATQTPVVIGNIAELLGENESKKVGILSFQEFYPRIPSEYQRVLSPQGSLAEAAQNLFAAMRELDELDQELILTEKFPELGLGRAINDRLQRAAAR